MARPRIAIDWADFDKLCVIQATQEEIAGWFDCSVDTIDRAVKREKKMSFAEYWALKAAKGKISLRRAQFQSAQNGNATMQIWLGKQWLGQKDSQEFKIGPSNGPQPSGFFIEGLEEPKEQLLVYNDPNTIEVPVAGKDKG